MQELFTNRRTALVQKSGVNNRLPHQCYDVTETLFTTGPYKSLYDNITHLIGVCY